MDKRSAMEMVNEHLGNRLLYGRNTSFANINAAVPLWWMTIDPSKFKSDLHLLLAKEGDGGLIWLRIKGNAFPDVSKVFRVRQDNGHKGWIDWGIASRPPKYMTDVKSGGTEYDFTKHIEHEWGRPAWTAPGAKGAGTGKGGAERVLTVQRLVEKVESVREEKRRSSERVKALWEFGKAIFGRNNRAKSDERVYLHVELRTLRPGARESSSSWDSFELGEWHLPDADAMETMSRVDSALMDAGFEPYNVPS